MQFYKMKQFLIDNNCLRKFINNCVGATSYRKRQSNIKFLSNVNCNTSNPIRASFIWANTKEGRDYWCNLAHKFESCNENKRTDIEIF